MHRYESDMQYAFSVVKRNADGLFILVVRQVFTSSPWRYTIKQQTNLNPYIKPRRSGRTNFDIYVKRCGGEEFSFSYFGLTTNLNPTLGLEGER